MNTVKSKKKVVYLLGSGATQAVVKAINPDLGLLTPDIQEEIEKTPPTEEISNIIWNELVTKGNDIEHLISVLESQHNYSTSEKLRSLYRDAIVNLSIEISKNLPPNNLYSVLVDLHNIKDFDEELSSFITLNYEDILEKTITRHFDYGIDYIIQTKNKKPKIKKSIKVVKLHGSFTWFNSRPISVKEMDDIGPHNALWIPPGVEKRKEDYPFNLLWGKAVEDLLNCNILRVVGCSLNRNDWGLISVLYTVQKFTEKGNAMSIEIIDYPEIAQKIKDTYKYLNIKSILDLPDLFSFYRKQFPDNSPEDLITSEIDAKFLNKDTSNPLQEWLDAKADYLIDQQIDISTERNFLYNLYYRG